jgi:uncharacterized protein YegP (UPF0339 family)
MNRSARFEVCRGDDGWWARFRAANGRIVWVTETYTRRRAAVRAIRALVDPFRGCWLDPHSGQVEYRKDSWNKTDAILIEVREVDERIGERP